MHSTRHFRLIILAMFIFSWPWVAGIAAKQAVPKQVHLVVKGNRLIASNILTSRFDEFRLKPRERVNHKSVSNGVFVVVTNQRILAYGVGSGWRSLDVKVNERVTELTSEDYAVLVVTNKRIINFNGQTGIWGKSDLPIQR